MYLDYESINYHINNSGSNLNSKTMGYGMVFFHEFKHSIVGGHMKHAPSEMKEYGPAGEIENHVNLIRRELDTNPINKILSGGKQYGQRNNYVGSLVSETNIKYNKQSAIRVVSQIAFTVSVLKRGGKATPATEHVGHSIIKPASK